MTEQSRGRNAGLWLRLVGFALIPLSVQAFQPIIGASLGILTPLPLAYGMARRGYLEGTAAVTFVAFLTYLVLGTGQGLSFLLQTLPMAVGIGWIARSRIHLYKTVLQAAGLVVLVTLAAGGFYSLAMGTGPAGLYQEVSQEMALLLQTTQGTEDLPLEQLQRVKWFTGIMLRIIIGFWISMVLLLQTFYAMVIREWLIAAETIKNEGLALLSNWRLPFPFVGIFVVLASTWLLTGGLVKDVVLNCMFPLGTLFGIQGMVIVGHLFTRWTVPPYFRAMVLMTGIIFFQLVFMLMVALLGLFDNWIDFRRRWPLDMTPSPPST